MQNTRQLILDILKRDGEVTVQDLSRELKLTSVTVRHHLEILRSQGYITEPEVQRTSTPGRPRYVYRLAQTAVDLFPNNYRGLASALLESVCTRAEPQQREALLEESAQRLVAQLGPLPENRTARLNTLVNRLRALGFEAEWQVDKDGQDHIIVCNCPYAAVSESCPEVCQIDRRMFEIATGAQLQPVTPKPPHVVCEYRLKWPESR